MRAGARASAILWLLLAPAAAAVAHGTDYEVLSTGVVGVRATYDDGAPIADASVLVFAPGEATAAFESRTDSHGIVCFAPDRAGTWVLQVRGASGHGLRANLEIDEALELAGGRTRGALSAAQIAVMAVCVCWGFVGTALFFRRKARR